MSDCRFCSTPLTEEFIDLGMSPLSNAFLKESALDKKEPFYPLKGYICKACFLAQLEEFESPEEIFNDDYAYYSSYSSSWLEHSKNYVDMISQRLGLNEESLVIELASNDGYLLQYFIKMGIGVLGIEPAQKCAQEAIKKGAPTLIDFFSVKTATKLKAEGKMADLLLGNNVLAHVPRINDFVSGMRIVLKTSGVITMEFPSLMRLMEGNQYDTVYHEHFCYLSLHAVEKIFLRQGLVIFDVEEIPTHGGSLRIYARHEENAALPISVNVQNQKDAEKRFGIIDIGTYKLFKEKVERHKIDVLNFLKKAKMDGKSVIGYGAPAKSTTLFNFCDIKSDMIEYTVDMSPHKQGMYIPGVHIPIKSTERIMETKPDYVVILPWNIKDEIMDQIKYIRDWGGEFVTFMPEVRVI